MREGVTVDGRGFHLAPEIVYGLLLAWNGTLIVLTELPLTSVTLRFNARRVMALGYILIGVGFGLNAFCDTVPKLWLAMTIFTLGEMISAPTTSAFVARLAPEHLRGRYMGILALAWNGAGILGPQFGFRLFAYDPRFVWFGCAAPGLIGGGGDDAGLRQIDHVAGEQGLHASEDPEPSGRALNARSRFDIPSSRSAYEPFF